MPNFLMNMLSSPQMQLSLAHLAEQEKEPVPQAPSTSNPNTENQLELAMRNQRRARGLAANILNGGQGITSAPSLSQTLLGGF